VVGLLAVHPVAAAGHPAAAVEFIEEDK